jgi:hypothetical protein
MKLHNMHFVYRQEISTAASFKLMNSLFEKKIFKFFVRAQEEEDKNGVDYLIKWEDGRDRESGPWVRIQFKNREDNYQDFPVLRFQPLYGTDSDKTRIGRDFIGLQDKKNDLFFTAVKTNSNDYSEVLVIKSEKLLALIEEAEKEWFPIGEPWEYFTKKFCNKMKRKSKRLKKASNGVEAWYQKTESEKSPKINLYVPRKYADEVIKL